MVIEEHDDRRPFPARALAWTTTVLRWPVVAAWIAAAVFAVVRLPTLAEAPSPGLDDLVGNDAPPLRAERMATERFAVPPPSHTVVVQRDPDGLRVGEELRVLRRALRSTLLDAGTRRKGLLAAVPVTDRLVARGRDPATTVVYYLVFRPEVDPGARLRLAREFAAGLPRSRGSFAGVTGLVPAQLERQDLADRRLVWVTAATVLFVLLAIAVYFRSLVAPLVNLFALAVAYLVATRVIAWGSQRLDVPVPGQAEPVVVVLVFGVVTDYAVFLLARMRRSVIETPKRALAARIAARDTVGIIITAALAVAATTGAVAVAQTNFFAAFGPALAVTTLIGMVVALTLVPALLAILGERVFAPRASQRDHEAGAEEPERGGPIAGRVVGLVTRHPWPVVVVVLAGLAAASTGLLHAHLALPEIRGLPAGNEVDRAYAAAARGFSAEGVVAPSYAILEAPGLRRRRQPVARFQRLLAAEPGVARVLGPANQPLPRPLGLAIARDGGAARYGFVLKDDPLDRRAIATIERIRERAPELARRAGLPDASITLGGDTALAAEIVDRTLADLARTTPVALVALFLVLAIYLRALVAPLLLVASSTVGVVASLGIVAWIRPTIVDVGSIDFFVPFATAVLLLGLSTDYTVFLVGRVWREAPRRRIREAVAVGSARAARPIAMAGTVLAGSFALLAIIPISSFRLAAATMAIGLMLDAFVIRTLLVPALVALAGRRSGWPGAALER